MKKLSNEKLENLRGGWKCIYHGMAAAGLTFTIGILPTWLFGGYNAAAECWNGTHVE